MYMKVTQEKLNYEKTKVLLSKRAWCSWRHQSPGFLHGDKRKLNIIVRVRILLLNYSRPGKLCSSSQLLLKAKTQFIQFKNHFILLQDSLITLHHHFYEKKNEEQNF